MRQKRVLTLVSRSWYTVAVEEMRNVRRPGNSRHAIAHNDIRK